MTDSNLPAIVPEVVPVGIWECSEAEYHGAFDYTSNTMLKTFSDSPQRFHGQFVARSIPFTETDALRIGRYLHYATLEPDHWKSQFVVKPECDRRYKEGKAIYAAYLESLEGRQEIDPDEQALANAMREGLFSNPISRMWLNAAGPREQAIVWQDSDTAVMCRSRRDKIVETTAGPVIIDLKTMSDVPTPENFARAAHKWKYDRQAAFYTGGHLAVFEVLPRMLFLAVHKKPPHEVGCYEIESEFVDLARDKNSENLRELARRYEADDWLPVWSKEPQTVKLPRYSTYNDYEATNGN